MTKLKFLNKNLKIFFLDNSIYLQGDFGNLNFKIPTHLINKKKVITFLFLNVKNYYKFYNNFFLNYYKIYYFYFFRVKLKGLGFKVKQISTYLYRVFFSRSCYIYINVPNVIVLKLRKRKLLFLSSYNFLLKTFFSYVILLKKIGPYNRIGFLVPREIIRLKKKKKLFMN